MAREKKVPVEKAADRSGRADTVMVAIGGQGR